MKDMRENGLGLPVPADEVSAGRDCGSSEGLLVRPEEIEAARQFADASRASSTRRAYASDWRLFVAWCGERKVSPLPAHPALVAVYLASEAERGVKPSTISRRLSAIGYYHHRSQLPAPTATAGAVAIKEVMAGVRRTFGVAPDRKRAADGEILQLMLATIAGDDLRARRDRAVLAIGMAAALRRSELVALVAGDVTFVREGLLLKIGRSKTDQDGIGETIAIPRGQVVRPPALLSQWLNAAGHKEGPLFRRLTRKHALTEHAMSDRAVARLVKACAFDAGFNPLEFAGHSLRAGFLTEGAKQGASVFKLQQVSRHRSLDVLSAYVRDAELFRDHAGQAFL